MESTHWWDICDHCLECTGDCPPTIDLAIIKAEKVLKTKKARTSRKASVDPEYRRRLQEAGLGDVLATFIRKGE